MLIIVTVYTGLMFGQCKQEAECWLLTTHFEAKRDITASTSIFYTISRDTIDQHKVQTGQFLPSVFNTKQIFWT